MSADRQTCMEDPYLSMPKRRQPSRFVVFSLSSMWKKGTGDSVSDFGAPGMLATTFSTVQGSFASAAERIAGARKGQR